MQRKWQLHTTMWVTISKSIVVLSLATITSAWLDCSAAFEWYFVARMTSVHVAQFIRLGRMGYTLILKNLMSTAKRLCTSLEKTGGSRLHVS